MTNRITVTREQVTEIVNAVNGIDALLRRLTSPPENQAVMYAIMSNPRADSKQSRRDASSNLKLTDYRLLGRARHRTRKTKVEAGDATE